MSRTVNRQAGKLEMSDCTLVLIPRQLSAPLSSPAERRIGRKEGRKEVSGSTLPAQIEADRRGRGEKRSTIRMRTQNKNKNEKNKVVLQGRKTDLVGRQDMAPRIPGRIDDPDPCLLSWELSSDYSGSPLAPGISGVQCSICSANGI